MKGKVKFYNRSKDFGFIAGEGGTEYYFNSASMRMPQDNDSVEFETQKTNRGEVAKMVMPAGVACGTSKKACPWGVGVVSAVVALIIGIVIGHFI